MKSISIELVSTRIKHTGKCNWKAKIREAIHTAFKVRFQRDQTKYGLTGTGSGLLRILFRAGCKNKS